MMMAMMLVMTPLLLLDFRLIRISVAAADAAYATVDDGDIIIIIYVGVIIIIIRRRVPHLLLLMSMVMTSDVVDDGDNDNVVLIMLILLMMSMVLSLMEMMMIVIILLLLLLLFIIIVINSNYCYYYAVDYAASDIINENTLFCDSIQTYLPAFNNCQSMRLVVASDCATQIYYLLNTLRLTLLPLDSFRFLVDARCRKSSTSPAEPIMRTSGASRRAPCRQTPRCSRRRARPSWLSSLSEAACSR